MAQISHSVEYVWFSRFYTNKNMYFLSLEKSDEQWTFLRLTFYALYHFISVLASDVKKKKNVKTDRCFQSIAAIGDVWQKEWWINESVIIEIHKVAVHFKQDSCVFGIALRQRETWKRHGVVGATSSQRAREKRRSKGAKCCWKEERDEGEKEKTERRQERKKRGKKRRRRRRRQAAGEMKEGEKERKGGHTRTRWNCPAINDTMLLRLSFFAPRPPLARVQAVDGHFGIWDWERKSARGTRERALSRPRSVPRVLPSPIKVATRRRESIAIERTAKRTIRTQPVYFRRLKSVQFWWAQFLIYE